MRRPEISGFISISPPANLYDFTFLAPCPASGLIIQGDADRVVPIEDVDKLIERLNAQKGITITYKIFEQANHFFENDMDKLKDEVAAYLDQRIPEIGGI